MVRMAEVVPEAEFLKNYRVGKEIGRGGYSIVYEAIFRPTNEKVALKVIAKKTATVEEDTLREFAIQRKFESPFVVDVIDFANTPTKFFLVLEFVKGTELFEAILNGGAFSEADAADYTKQILLGLKVLHGNGIIHRDLKPENVILEDRDDGTKQVKLLDFGLSAFYKGQKFKEYVGTLEYASPQILQNIPYGVATDLWTVGVIAYVMLCAFRPYEGRSQSELLHNILTAPLDFPSPEWDGISDQARDFCARLICVEECDRMTVDQALGHPWLKDAPTKPIVNLAEHLKVWHVKQKMARVFMAAETAMFLADLGQFADSG